MVRLHRACHFAAKKPQNGFGEIVACLALGVLGKVDAVGKVAQCEQSKYCLLYTSPSPRDKRQSRMPSSA